MESQEKKGRGGARPGAGRKSKGENAKRKTISISGTPAEIDELKQKAAEAGKTTSRFLIELALEKNHPTSEQWKQMKKATKN